MSDQPTQSLTLSDEFSSVSDSEFEEDQDEWENTVDDGLSNAAR